MSLFDAQAIEAALIAFNHWDAEKMKEAFTAAEASMRDRGLVTDGKHMALSENGAGNMDLGSCEFWRGDFSFSTIKKAKS
jgi:hypothetical protein